MSRSPDRGHQSALSDIESRITVLERRLRNARAARDSYVDYLRGKYPHWRPSLPTYNKHEKNEENLVSRLSTSAYHWEGSRQTFTKPPPPQPHYYHQIPLRGPFLDSDFVRTRDRLTVMSQQLRVLRDARLNMSTDEYFRARASRMPGEGTFYEEAEIPSMEGVRRRLADMTFSLMEPPTTPTQERIDEMKRLEQREKMIQDIRNGVLPSVATVENEPTFTFNEPKTQFVPQPVEEPHRPIEPTEAPKELTQQSGPRITFVDTKPPVAAPQAPKPEPVQPPASTGNTYSKMLNMLTKTDSTESDDVHEPSAKAPTATTIQQSIKEEEPKPVLGSLSMYLQKSAAPKHIPIRKQNMEPDSDSDDFFD